MNEWLRIKTKRISYLIKIDNIYEICVPYNDNGIYIVKMFLVGENSPDIYRFENLDEAMKFYDEIFRLLKIDKIHEIEYKFKYG